MKGFFKDFKEFVMKGNVVDMAVGVVIGSAFGKIVSSFVADIITPLLSLLLGKVNLSDLKWVIKEAVVDSTGKILENETALTYGNFLQSVLDLLIIALSIFLVLRIMMSVKNKILARIKIEKEEAEQAAPPAPTELDMLTEIRDLLRDRKD